MNYVESDARFSSDRIYRYWLLRRWNVALPQFTYVLLNPSRADETADDGTVTALRRFTTEHRGGGFELVNLFAYVDPSPTSVPLGPAAVGPENDAWIASTVQRSSRLVVGWGNSHKEVRRRSRAVLTMLDNRPLSCFGQNGDGTPKHPGRLSKTTRLVGYASSGASNE